MGVGAETADIQNRAELGRAAWKLLHTTMARFPDAPSEDEQIALFSYVHLFARLYPWYLPTPSPAIHLAFPALPFSYCRSCPQSLPLIAEHDADFSLYSGECASHFRQILQRFPPQVKTRSSASAWACHVHNEVNKSLKKAVFDCSHIGDFYNCGCAENEAETKAASEKEVRFRNSYKFGQECS